ncbi:MAG: FmdE family protein [bacterium]
MARWRKLDDDLLQDAALFHGILAPGLYLGFFMIEKARELLGSRDMIDAVVETVKCLPDSVQLMTPCTVGNGWLKVFDYGNFALTLYDKKTKEGVRIWVDLKKVPSETVFYKWFTRKEKDKEGNLEIILGEIKRLNSSLFSFSRVKVELEKEKHLPLIICKKCGELFPDKNNVDGLCLSCQGKGYWIPAFAGMT